MEAKGLCLIHLNLVQEQIVFVPLYFSIDRYLFFFSMSLQTRPWGYETEAVVRAVQGEDTAVLFIHLHDGIYLKMLCLYAFILHYSRLLFPFQG